MKIKIESKYNFFLSWETCI